jgi:WD40 repeat protein
MLVLGFSGDGKIVYLLVGKAGQEKGDRIAYWDIAARREIGSMATSGFETKYWLSPDGTLLAEGSWGSVRPLRIFDLAGRRELKPLKGRAAAFSADSRWLGVSHRDGTLRVWDTRTWKPVSPPLRVAEAASSGPLAFSPDGRLLLTGSGTGRVNVWDTASWTWQTSFQAHAAQVKNIDFSPDGKTVITREEGSVDKMWNRATWRQTLSLPVGNGAWLAYFTPDGNTLVTTGESTTRIWRAASLAEADAPPRSSVAQATDPPPPTRTPKPNATTTGIQKAP